MDKIAFGSKQAVVHCVKVKSGDKIVVITDHESERMGDAIIRAAEAAGGFVRKFVMEDFGYRPQDGKKPLLFPAEIRNTMINAQVSFYIASTRFGEQASFRKPMIKTVEKYSLRHAHMPNFTKEIMCQGMSTDYLLVQRLCRKVYDIVSKARNIRVTTPSGTDFTVRLTPKHKWIICDGQISPTKWTNLPDGEVFTTPADANGVVVIDGCMGDIPTGRPGSMKVTPLTYELRHNRCVKGSIHCKNKALKNLFEKYTFGTDANSHRVGEFAIGTNLGLKKLIGIMLQDEKFPSVHLALGDPIGSETGARWSSKVHNDGLMLSPTITVDGKLIMKKGKFII